MDTICKGRVPTATMMCSPLVLPDNCAPPLPCHWQVYYIWYGAWVQGGVEQTVLEHFAANVGGSRW